MNQVNDNKNDSSFIEDYADNAGKSFPTKFLQTILFFLLSSKKFYGMVFNQKYDTILKPIPFFISVFAIMIAAMIGSTHFRLVTWQDVYDGLTTEQSKKEFIATFYHDDQYSYQDINVNIQILEPFLREKLNIYKNEIGADEILNYFKVQNNAIWVSKVSEIKSKNEKEIFLMPFMTSLLLLLYFLPIWRIMHFFLKPPNRTYKETITFFMYSTAFLFLFVLIPLSYSMNEINAFGVFALTAFFYLLVQQISNINFYFNVNIPRFIKASILTNISYFGLVFIALVILGLILMLVKYILSLFGINLNF